MGPLYTPLGLKSAAILPPRAATGGPMGGGHRAPALYVLGGGPGALAACSIVQTLRGAALRHAPHDAHVALALRHRLLRSFLLRLPVDWMSTGRRSKKEKHLDFPSPGHPCGPYPPPGPPLALSLHSTLHKPYSNPRTGPRDDCAANYALLGLHDWAYRCTVVALQP